MLHHAECRLDFLYAPDAAAWTTGASLRVDPHVLGLSPLPADDHSQSTTKEATPRVLQALFYVSCFHRLVEVALEEEEEANAVGSTESPTNEAAGDGVTPHQLRTPLAEYTWTAYAGSVMHDASSGDVGQTSKQQLAKSQTCQQETKAATVSCPAKRLTDTPPALFSTVMSSIPSSVGLAGDEEEEEDGAAHGRLVLQFDSVSSSAPSSHGVVETQLDAAPETPHTEAAPETPTDPPHPAASAEKTAETLRLDPSPPPPPSEPPLPASAAPSTGRRVLLLRPTATVAPLPSAETTAPAAAPAQGRRVLKVTAPMQSLASATASQVASVGTTSATAVPPLPPPPLQNQPPDTALKGIAADTKVSTAPDSLKAREAAAAIGVTGHQVSEGEGEAKVKAWLPYIFSCTYSARTDAALQQTRRNGRRLIAVHFTFDHVAPAGGAVTSRSPAARALSLREAQKTENWSRASVGACGAFARRHRTDGCALIVGDRGTQRCWMCPLVAPLTSLNDEATRNSMDRESASVLHAGPVQDPWVCSVSGRVLEGGFPQTQGDAAVKPPQLLQVKQEKEDNEEGEDACTDHCGAGVSPPPTAARLSCLSFHEAQLAHLSCVFGPPMADEEPDEAKSPLRSGAAEVWPRAAPVAAACRAEAEWPSSHVPGLRWRSRQVTRDCVHLRSLGTPSSSASALLVCLQSDIHLADAVYACYQHLQARWQREVMPALEAARSSLVSTTRDRRGVQGLEVVLTRTPPSSLTLRGGAVGTAHGLIVAEETARAAELNQMLRCTQKAPSVRVSSAVLRARVAVTAAVLQHLLWHAHSSLSMPESTARSDSPLSNSCPRELREDGSTRKMTTNGKGALGDAQMPQRLCNAARALATQWVCSDAEVLGGSVNSTLLFLREQRRLLTSMSAVGRLLTDRENESGLTGASSMHVCTEPSGSAVSQHILRDYQREYSAATAAALSWLAYISSELVELRAHAVVTQGLLRKQQGLCLWALGLCPPRHPSAGVLSHPFMALPFGIMSTVRDVRFMAAGDGPSPLQGDSTPLRGSVGVRIQHAALLNALHVELHWTTTVPVPAGRAAAVTGERSAASLCLPLYLFVFVLEEPAGAARGSAADSSDSESDEEGDGVTTGRDGSVYLYQVTPFNWYVPVRDCETAGATAEATLTIMHAMDLVARRPDAFGDFSVERVTQRAAAEGAHRASAHQVGAKRRRTATQRLRRTRGAGLEQRSAAGDDKEAKDEGGAAAVLSSRGGGNGRRRNAGPRRKRRRTRAHSSSSEGGSSNSSGGEGSEESVHLHFNDSLSDDEGGNEDDAAAAAMKERFAGRGEGAEGDTNKDNSNGEEDEDSEEDGVLMLNVGKRKRASRPSRRGSTAGKEEFSIVDTARVLPLVAFRRDCASPMVEVEMESGSAAMLAEQLAAAGYSPDPTGEDMRDGSSASSAVRRLLSYLIGVTAAQAVAPHAVRELREAEQRAMLLPPLAAQPDFCTTSAVSDGGVVLACGELLRALLHGLTPRGRSAAQCLAPLVCADAVLTQSLESRNVAAAARRAMEEYAQRDSTCRRRILEGELAATYAEVVDSAEAAARQKRKKKPTLAKKEQQQQQRQRVEGEASIARAVEASWQRRTATDAELVSVLFRDVLAALPSSQRAAVLDASRRGDTERGGERREHGDTNSSAPTALLATPLLSLSASFSQRVDALHTRRRLAEHRGVPSPPPAAASAAPAAPPFTRRLQLQTTAKEVPQQASLSAPPQADPCASAPTVASLRDACCSELGGPPGHHPQLEERRRLTAQLRGRNLSSSPSAAKEEEETQRILKAGARAVLASPSVEQPGTSCSPAAATAAASLALAVAQHSFLSA